MEKKYYWGKFELLDEDSDPQKIWIGPMTEKQMKEYDDEFRNNFCRIPPAAHESEEAEPIIDGTMVFVLHEGSKPFWIVQYQPNNGVNGSYWLTDASGESMVCERSEFTLTPQGPPESSV